MVSAMESQKAFDAVRRAHTQYLAAMLKKFGVEDKQLKSVGLYFESSGTDIRTIA